MNAASRWSRRDVMWLGGIVGVTRPAVNRMEPDGTAPRPLRTPLCELLGIEHAIVQAPMGGIAMAPLAAAVSRAGGLGILAGAGLAPEEVRRQIQKLRSLTDRPFGVNLILHPGMAAPADPASIPDKTLQAAQAVLNGFRQRLGLPASVARPPAVPNTVSGSIEVIVEERVPVLSIGLGRPSRDLVARCHARGMKVIAMAATVADSEELSAAGVDAVVAQGAEAGGHRSTWIKREGPDRAAIGTLALVPQVVDAVRQPVIAAGGIVNGRQVAAALALGAQGAMVGTRFIATQESSAPAFYKETLVRRDSDSTVVTDAFTGLYARVLRNAYADEYAASGAPVLPAVMQQLAAKDVAAASAARGDGSYYPMYAGQGVGMIRDVRRADAIVAALVREALAAMGSLSHHTGPHEG